MLNLIIVLKPEQNLKLLMVLNFQENGVVQRKLNLLVDALFVKIKN